MEMGRRFCHHVETPAPPQWRIWCIALIVQPQLVLT